MFTSFANSTVHRQVNSKMAGCRRYVPCPLSATTLTATALWRDPLSNLTQAWACCLLSTFHRRSSVTLSETSLNGCSFQPTAFCVQICCGRQTHLSFPCFSEMTFSAEKLEELKIQTLKHRLIRENFIFTLVCVSWCLPFCLFSDWCRFFFHTLTLRIQFCFMFNYRHNQFTLQNHFQRTLDFIRGSIQDWDLLENL